MNSSGSQVDVSASSEDIVSCVDVGTFAEIDYEVCDEEGTLLDSSQESGCMEVVFGYGMLVPGLEAAIRFMKLGEQKEVLIPPEAGFGEYDEELVFWIDRSEVPNPETVQVGEEFWAEEEGEEPAPLRVIAIREDEVQVDGNPPLAGMNLHYTIKITSLRRASTEEIMEAASAFEEARVLESPEEELPSLINLRKKE